MTNDIKQFAEGWGKFLLANTTHTDAIEMVQHGLDLLSFECPEDKVSFERLTSVKTYLENSYAKSIN